MSDDFDDDNFDFDDSFLREVDNLEAKATTKATGVPNHFVTPSAQVSQQRWSNSSNGAYKPVAPARSSNAGPTIARRAAPPSSDDYEDLSLDLESITALENISRPTSDKARVNVPRQNVIPSSRLGLARSSSSSSTSFQTHLNFRKENQTTKGKRWDRTAFAESGRRVDAEKAKAKGKGKYQPRQWARDDDEMEESEEEEEGDFEPLVPGPKPLIDVSKPYDPQKHLPNSATIDTYIYPTNRPKRDYQYEIVRACFTDNCLVALPTGLGKTFVAGVVMLNFYRWFPTGKIVFLAPTKPLVNQQIEACQMTCGIPSADAAVMTGSSVSAGQRAKKWEERRVFYCTPQTLDNDLKNGSIDAKDIVLAVFDEAHKASGSYAYTTILAYITAQNPYFRVLALTATPGADVPRVQAVVDALHISRIEIREAEAPEIRKYMNEKRTEKHFVQMGEVIEEFRDRFADLMKPNVKKLVDADILNDRDLDVRKMRTFRLTSKRMEVLRSKNPSQRWSIGPLQSLEKMARAMGHLLEFSIGMFHTILSEIAGNKTAEGKKSMSKGGANSMRNNFEFQKLMRDVEAEINSIRVGRGGRTKADKHPKMQKTLELLLAHFTQASDDERDHGTKNDTRAMVFCSYREAVLEIVDMLNEHSGILSATKFVGQSQGKQENDKGFTQKEQKQAIADFKDGKFNVLVSTSIGEEGLDIGEVDFVVIYDMPKQSIKLLQRIGRTGRKRDGKVHVLMSEGREDANWDKAQQTHRDIQEEILHSRNLELFEDVQRMLPPGKLPECVEQEMPVDPWDPEEGKTRKRLKGAEKEKEPKAKKQRGHEIPENGHTGFKSVSELLKECGKMPSASSNASVKAPRKSRTKQTLSATRLRAKDADGNEIPDAWDDVVGEPSVPVTKPKTARKAKGRKQEQPTTKRSEKTRVNVVHSESEDSGVSDDLDDLFANIGNKREGDKGKGKSRERLPSSPHSETLIDGSLQREALSEGRIVVDVSDDEDHSQTLVEKSAVKQAIRLDVSHKINESARDAKNGLNVGRSDNRRSPMPPVDISEMNDEGGLDFFMTSTMPRRRGDSPLATPPSSPPAEDTHARFPLSPDSHPLPLRAQQDVSLSHDNKIAGLGGAKLSPSIAAAAGFSQIAPIDLEWEDDLMSSPVPPPFALLSSAPPQDTQDNQRSPMGAFVESNHPSSGMRRRIMGISKAKSTHTPLKASASSIAMPPPPVPIHKSSPMVTSPMASMRPHTLIPSSPSAPTPPPLRRTARRQPAPAPRSNVAELARQRRAQGSVHDRERRKKQKISKEVGKYLDLDVELSGSEGSSDEPSSDIETESDRLFAGEEFAPTQAPKGYNQRAAYMAGMSTQAAGNNGLKFKSRYDTEGFLAKARKPVLVSDEERSDESENEYEMGSFVCDDEDISFATQTHTDPLDSQ